MKSKLYGTMMALLILIMIGSVCATPEPMGVQTNDVVKDAITMKPVVIDGGGPVGGDGNVTETEPTPPPGAPGFAGVFVILGILIVAYLHYRKKQ